MAIKLLLAGIIGTISLLYFCFYCYKFSKESLYEKRKKYKSKMLEGFIGIIVAGVIIYNP